MPYGIAYLVKIWFSGGAWFAVTCLLVNKAVIVIVTVHFCQHFSYAFCCSFLKSTHIPVAMKYGCKQLELLSLYMYRCPCMCVYLCVCVFVCVCTRTLEDIVAWLSFLGSHSPGCFLKQCLLLFFACFHLTKSGKYTAPCLAFWFWRIKLRSSCLQGQHFTKWAISPGPLTHDKKRVVCITIYSSTTSELNNIE